MTLVTKMKSTDVFLIHTGNVQLLVEMLPVSIDVFFFFRAFSCFIWIPFIA